MSNPTPDKNSRGPQRSGRPSGRGQTGRPGGQGASSGSGRPTGKGKPADRSGDRPYGKGKPVGRSGDGRYSKDRPAEQAGDRPYRKSGPGQRSEERPYRKSKPIDATGSDRPYRKSGPAEQTGGRAQGKGRPGERGDGRPYRKSKPGERTGDRPYRESGRAERAGDRPYGKGRPERSENRPYSKSRPGDRPGERPHREARPDDRPREAPRPGLAAKPNEPETPKGLDLRQLPRGVRAELRGLSAERAETVGAHLLMAGQLIDTDPELAHAHAEAARRRAARLPITREAAAETAYAAGYYAAALAEFRALRRMRGGDEYLPAMADCERALGRHQAALKLIKEGLAANPEVGPLVELRLVEAGIRVDTGRRDEALRLLRAEIERIGARGPKVARARLRYAYADLLERAGESDQAERWFDAVVRLDPDQSTDAEDRLAALRGLVIEYDESEDELVDETGEAPEDAAEGVSQE